MGKKILCLLYEHIFNKQKTLLFMQGLGVDISYCY